VGERLPDVTADEVISVLGRLGFKFSRQKGGHAIFKKDGIRIPVPVHGKRSIPHGLLRAIIREAGISVEEFNRLLKK